MLQKHQNHFKTKYILVDVWIYHDFSEPQSTGVIFAKKLLESS